jgi:uncharacterized protein GlcG (DUF336 family)
MSKQVTLEVAEAVIVAAKQKTVQIGQPMNIAVVDAGARLVAFARMDGAILASIDISQRKAMTAMMLKMTTRDLAPLCQPGAPLFGIEGTNGGLVPFAGGIPLAGGDGEPVGAIGVSAGRWSRITRSPRRARRPSPTADACAVGPLPVPARLPQRLWGRYVNLR